MKVLIEWKGKWGEMEAVIYDILGEGELEEDQRYDVG